MAQPWDVCMAVPYRFALGDADIATQCSFPQLCGVWGISLAFPWDDAVRHLCKAEHNL